MADLLIPRKPYGSLLLEAADQVAIEFFASDDSSVDEGFEISFDDRAAQFAELGAFEETDVRVLQRGMRLYRTPRITWDWLKSDAAPLGAIEVIPEDVDLILASDEQYTEVRALMGPRSRRSSPTTQPTSAGRLSPPRFSIYAGPS